MARQSAQTPAELAQIAELQERARLRRERRARVPVGPVRSDRSPALGFDKGGAFDPFGAMRRR